MEQNESSHNKDFNEADKNTGYTGNACRLLSRSMLLSYVNKAWPIFLKSSKVRYRTAQSFPFNGVIYLSSILVVSIRCFPD